MIIRNEGFLACPVVILGIAEKKQIHLILWYILQFYPKDNKAQVSNYI